MDHPLAEKFPDLQPGRKPSLGSVYGCGTTLIGRRDYDPETGTYVTTHCFTLLFIPLFALGAYRVASAGGGGWYCLGKVPLSGFVRIWNFVLALAILGGIGGIWWNAHTKSPEYVAGQKLKQADQAAAAGQGGQAARLCREVMDGKTSKVDQAKEKLAGFIANPPGAPSEAAAVYTVAVDLHRENRCPVNDLFDVGKGVAARFAESDPAAALDLLEMIAPFAPHAEEELALRRDLLEKLHARNPNDPDTASRLAAACEAKGERDRCEKLLAPFEEQLGTRDGAAILGRVYAARGEYDRAYKLLRPFVDTRLPAMRSAEQNLRTQLKASEERVIGALKSKQADGFDYDHYNRLPDAQQGAMVEEYIGQQLRKDAVLREAQKRLIAERGVVGAVFDLGLVQLQRAQTMPDPAARKAELEAAEKTFLSIRGFAGESEEYRLSLGQVYYWLGRQAEGKKLFDELITSRGQATEVVLLVARTLREVGDFTEARKIVEDAYQRETDVTKKQFAAHFRALMMTDLDDEIVWLSRAKPDDPSVQAALAGARGGKAAQDGKDGEAAGHYRKAIEHYDKMPESAATLNNSSLVHFALYHITQDRAEFTRGLDKLDRAIALQPSNTISLNNGAEVVLDSAAREVIGHEVDFRVLKRGGGLEVLPYLYRSPAERAAVVERLARHPGTIKARTYAEKLLTLAPKRSDAYEILLGIFGRTRDIEGLKATLARLEQAELDLGDATREYNDHLTGQSDAKRAEDARKAVARAAEVLEAVKGRKDRTFAVAVSRYVRAKQAAWVFGDSFDAEEAVRLTEEAHAAAPSEGTEGMLVLALLFRAHTTLSREEAEYAKLADRTKRSLGTLLVYYLLSSEAPLKAKVAANADVKRLAAMVLDDFRRDPDAHGLFTWVMIRAALPQDVAAVAEKVKVNERLRLRDRIDHLLTPYSAQNGLEEYWRLQLEGKEAEAKRVLAGLAARGVPLP